MNDDSEDELWINCVCRRFLKNDPNTTHMCITLPEPATGFMDETHFEQLGRSMIGNTNIKSLEWCGHDMFQFDVKHATQNALEALANGFESSIVQSITLRSVCPELAHFILQAAQLASRLQSIIIMWCPYSHLLPAVKVPPALLCRLEELTIIHCACFDMESIRLLAPALQRGSSLQKLKIEHTDISDDMMAAFTGFWHRDSPLKDFNLINNKLTMYATQMLLRAIGTTHPTLKRLGLHGNNIGYSGLQMLGNELAKMALVELDLNFLVNYGNNTAVKVTACRAFAKGLCENATIEKLNLGKNDIDPLEVLRATTSRKILMDLDVPVTCPNDLVLLGNGLGNARLSHQRLSTCPFDAKQYSNEIWDAAFHVFLGGLCENTTIQSLAVGWGIITSKQASMIMVALEDHPSLKRLDLSRNRGIGFDGLRQIGNHLSTATLKSLVLDACVDYEASRSQSEGRDQAYMALAEGLRNCRTLEELSFKSNNIAFSEIMLLLGAAANHSSMAILSLPDTCKLNLAESNLLAGALPALRLKELNLSYHYGSFSIDGSSAAARRALVEGVKNNCFLSKFGVHIRWGDDESPDPEFDFYLGLNRLGRLHLLIHPGHAPNLWCHVLGRPNVTASHLFYFLREQPALITWGAASPR